MLDSALAGRMGRPNLSRSGRLTSAGNGGNVSGEPEGLASVDISGSTSLVVGKLSAGLLGGVVIGMVAFYIWTRAQQA